MKREKEVARSENPAELKRRGLAELLPEAFSEGRLDIEALRRALGEDGIVDGGERYRLDWAGKNDAYKVLQQPTTATLRPQRDKSVNFDTAGHVFIEGENLETLKVLQKAYFGKVKMIYIDPPYNTGNDSFVYPDRFQESREDYLKRINELSDDGTLMREGYFRKNSRDSGHYHSNWLSMMLPRLYIARNLLCDDGVIFVSCDDNEVYNLHYLMNEIFGEENFISNVIWQHSIQPKGYVEKFSIHHNFILCFQKSPEFELHALARTDEDNKNYSNPDNDPRGSWRAGDVRNSLYRPNLIYDITTPSGKVIHPPKNGWRWSKKTVEGKIRENEIVFSNDETKIIRKIYLENVQGRAPESIWFGKKVGTTRDAARELKDLFGGDNPFDTPKPTKLVRQMLQLATTTDEPALIMDFFAGSGTTLEAVLQQNADDGGNRSCVLVQLDEPLDGSSPMFSTIADVTRRRISNAFQKFSEKEDLFKGSTGGFGYRSFKLTSSSFKQWRGDGIEDAEELAEQMKMFVHSEKEGTVTEAVLYELLLKFGQELTTPIETLNVEGGRVFAVRDRRMLFVLEDFSEAMIDPLLALKPREVIALDSVFRDSDELKTNFDLQCRDADVKFTCI